MPFKQLKLENGLRVVLSEDHSVPVIAVAVYYDVGSRNEVRGRSGFAHLFEHMMFQGSENVRKAEHFSYVENNGGYVNGSTQVDYTNYYQMLPSNQLELALWLESDRMRSLKITPANLQNQKEAVKEEKRLNVDNQAYWPSLNRMDEMLFRNWAYSHSTIGSMKDLDAATIADVRAFFKIHYAPNNAVLAIAGDFDSDRAAALVKKYFGSIPPQPTAPGVNISEPAEVAQPKAVVEDPLAQMPAIAIGWKIPTSRSSDSYAVALLNSLLADGESSRLYQALVKKRAVSLEIQSYFEERRGPGAMTLFSIHKADVKPEDVENIIDQEIERVVSEGVTGDELEKVKNQYRLGQFVGGDGSEYESLQTPLGRALELAEFTLFDNDPSLINTEMERYLAVTPEQVRAAARKYLKTANRSVLYIRPASGATKGAAGQQR